MKLFSADKHMQQYENIGKFWNSILAIVIKEQNIIKLVQAAVKFGVKDTYHQKLQLDMFETSHTNYQIDVCWSVSTSHVWSFYWIDTKHMRV